MAKNTIKLRVPIVKTIKKMIPVAMPEFVHFHVTQQSILDEMAECGPTRIREYDDTNGHKDRGFIVIYRLVQIRRRRRKRQRRR
jgi:hypothetical protein